MTEVLVFDIDGQRYGLLSSVVVTVIRAVAITPLPNAPAIIQGMINYRGAIVPVLDIRARFGLSVKALSPSDQLIVARAGPRVVALPVDQSIELIEIEADDICEVASFAPTVSHIAGVAALRSGLVIIQNMSSFLAQAEAEGLDQALEQVAGA